MAIRLVMIKGPEADGSLNSNPFTSYPGEVYSPHLQLLNSPYDLRSLCDLSVSPDDVILFQASTEFGATAEKIPCRKKGYFDLEDVNRAIEIMRKTLTPKDAFVLYINAHGSPTNKDPSSLWISNCRIVPSD